MCSIRRMSGEKGDKGMDVAAESSLSGARKYGQTERERKRVGETDIICHTKG